MPRRHFLLTYDISDDKRRTKVFKTLLGAGDHVQYSVFFCDLNERELAALRGTIRPLLHRQEDQLLIVDLGPAEGSLIEGIEALGRGYEPTTRILVI